MESSYDSFPYFEHEHFDLGLMHLIREGERPRLEGLNDLIEKLIMKCWDVKPNRRPNFEEITHSLIEMKSELVKRNEIDETEVNNFFIYAQMK